MNVIGSVRARRVRTIGIAALALLVPGAFQTGAAAAADRFYRDSATMRTSPPERYLIEVPRQAAMHGEYFEVETDALDRVSKVSTWEDGTVTGVVLYEYAGNSMYPYDSKSFKSDVLTGVTKYERDAAGEVTSGEDFDASGNATGRWVESFYPDHSDEISYNAAGEERDRATTYYTADGQELRSVGTDSGSTRSTDTMYDLRTGLSTATKTYDKGSLIYSKTISRDSDDDIVRVDTYDDKGVWYSADFYEQNLFVRRTYKFSDGSTKEIRYHHDSKRWVEKAEQYVNDKLVCTFLYQHLGDGTTSKTLAMGPDGSLWGEYTRYVGEVGPDGHAPGSTDGVIHKSGNWW
jgi:hypothetical protein